MVDLYRLMVHPIVLGKGRRLFEDGPGDQALRLTETRRFGTGIVILEYTPAETP